MYTGAGNDTAFLSGDEANKVADPVRPYLFKLRWHLQFPILIVGYLSGKRASRQVYTKLTGG